jgi:signal transduction histidine kinase
MASDPAAARADEHPTVRGWDLVLFAGVTFLVAGAFRFHAPEAGERAYDLVAYALAAVALSSLLIRRRWPVVALVVSLGATSAWFLRDYPGGPIVATVVIALVSVGEMGDRKRSMLVGIVASAVSVVTVALHSGDGFISPAVFAAAGWVAAPLFLGDAIQNRRAYVLAVEERARQAEQTREEEARRRVDEERMRIARELHDVVAHGIAMINVQAGVAAHVIDQRPDDARAALVAIKQASGEALRELRATLGVLRGVGEPDAPPAPSPSLGDLGALLATIRSAGLAVELVDDRPVGPVPAGIGLTAYRIIQESLTNVVRHARATQAWVSVIQIDDRLVLEVVDDGAGPAVTDIVEPGHGIAGMQERVRALAGVLDAGPAAGGGFRVHAELPLERVTA